MAASTTLTPEQIRERSRKAGKASGAQRAARARTDRLTAAVADVARATPEEIRAAAVRASVDAAPPLTPEQIDRLRAVLAPVQGAASK